jgi:predicted HicB family RNase H-like nuclease
MQMLDSGKELTANEHEWTRMETKKFTEKCKEHGENPNRG